MKLSEAIPFSFNRPTNKLCLAMKDPSDLSAFSAFKAISESNVQIFQGDPLEIDKYITEFSVFSMGSVPYDTLEYQQQVAI
jgi:hypothetical protein